MIETVKGGIDYGPLVLLVGTWKGDRGLDIAPEPDGVEREPYYEEIVFELGGDVTNAEEQKLAIISYHQQVYRKRNGEKFHDQVGYWLWDAANQTVMFTLSIPRAVTLVAGGSFDPATLTGPACKLEVKSQEGGEWGVAQSPFMRDKARTTGFEMMLSVDGNSMSYSQTTFLDIYGRTFDHIDTSELLKDA